MSSSLLQQQIHERATALGDWLADRAYQTAHEQRHLDPATSECAYWHHGYRAALIDILTALAASGSASHPEHAIH